MDTWSPNEASDAYGITPQQLNSLVRSGVLPKKGRGQFDPIATTLAYVAYVRKMAEESGGLTAARVSSEEARKELWFQQARKAKVIADEAEGLVVQRKDVTQSIQLLYDGLATVVRGSSLSEDKKEELFATLEEFAAGWAQEHGL